MRIFTTQVLFLFLLISTCLSLSAQTSEFLRGKILDQQTGKPVQFATVRIKGKTKGVITNMDGGFRLPITLRESGESIEISSMGFEKREFELQKLSPNDINLIRLVPGVVSLNEAVVIAKGKKRLSAREIVRRAVERISKNYPLSSFTTNGYYRDYQLDSLGYLNLNEALLQVFDYGFDEIDSITTKTRIYEYKQNTNFRRDTLADDSYNYKDRKKTIDNAYIESHGGNEFTILRVHDAIRNYKINSFDFINTMQDGDVLKNHSFKKMEDTYLDGEPIYTIQIKKILPGYEARGTVYISKNNYAIHKLQYAVYDDNKRNKNERLQEIGVKGELIFEIVSEYSRDSDFKMYLNYISFHNTFQLSIRPKFVIDDLLIMAEKRAFVLNFNNQPVIDPKFQSNEWYDFKYKDKKIEFEKIEIKSNSTIVLYPKMSSRDLSNMFGDLETMANKNRDVNAVMKFKVTGLKDMEGNVLNTWTYRNYDQFREFFAQETKLHFEIPTDNLLMNTRKPIFDAIQPIIKPDNFGDYWMNSPLKNKTN